MPHDPAAESSHSLETEVIMGALASVRRTLYGLGAVLFLLSLAPAAVAQHVGYVFEIDGDWRLDEQQLSRGYQLPAKGVVSIRSPAPDDHIVILDNNGELLARRRCNVPGECTRPVVLPEVKPARRSSAGILFDSVMQLLWGEKDKCILMRSRSLDLTDAVARLDGGKVDLGPVMKALEAEDYHLRMREVARVEKGSDGEWREPFALKWNPSDPASGVVPASGLRPGLYEIAALNYENGMYMPTNQSAWVLVGEGAAFESASAAQREALAVASKWGDAVAPEVARGFARAHLAQLSRQAAK